MQSVNISGVTYTLRDVHKTRAGAEKLAAKIKGDSYVQEFSIGAVTLYGVYVRV